MEKLDSEMKRLDLKIQTAVKSAKILPGPYQVEKYRESEIYAT